MGLCAYIWLIYIQYLSWTSSLPAAIQEAGPDFRCSFWPRTGVRKLVFHVPTNRIAFPATASLVVHASKEYNNLAARFRPGLPG